MAGLSCAAGLATVAIHLLVQPLDPDNTTEFFITNAVTAVSWGTVGGIVLQAGRRAPGALLLAIGAAHGLTGLTRELGLLASGSALPHVAAWLLWLGTWPFFATLWFPLLLMLLPDGQLAGPRWRPFGLAAFLAPIPLSIAVALSPGPLLLQPVPGRPVPQNPLGLVDLSGLAMLTGLLLLVSAPAAIASLVVRWRTDSTKRNQLKWVALAGATLLLLGLGVEMVLPWTGPVIAPLSVATFAAAMGVALVRHRLLDVDVLISRTFLYAALTGLLAGLYVTVSVLLGSALSGPTPDIVATTAVALSFAPAREALQRGVSRLFYGLRDEPGEVLRRVGQAVDDSPSVEEVLPQLADALARALRLRHASVLLPDEPLPADCPADSAFIPLRHRDQDVGRLVIAPRDPGGHLGMREEQLLAELARQAATAAHAVLLTAELRVSRDRLIATREEERRRLSRDLHDGIGPLLSTVSLQLDAATRLLARDPDQARSLIGEARSEVQEAVGEVRRLLDDLRPRALEELGFEGAIAAAVRAAGAGGIETSFDMDPGVGLAPGVELSLYRIISEALTNVTRHSGASSMVVQIGCEDDEVVARVSDDGRGLVAGTEPGLGLVSMKERAAELGGVVTLDTDGEGTVVTIRLPTRSVGRSAGVS